MLATAVDGHNVDRSDGGRVFAAHQCRTFPDAFDLFGQILLQMVFDTVFDQPRIFAQIVCFVGINMLQCHFEHVIGFIRRSTNDFLRNLRSHVVVGMFRSDVFDGAGRRHPVEWLVRTKFGENQQTVIGFDKQHTLGERQGRIQTPGIFGRAISNNNSHEALPYHDCRKP